MLHFIKIAFINLVFMQCIITTDLHPQATPCPPKPRVFRLYQKAKGVAALHYFDEVQLQKNCLYVDDESTSLK